MLRCDAALVAALRVVLLDYLQHEPATYHACRLRLPRLRRCFDSMHLAPRVQARASVPQHSMLDRVELTRLDPAQWLCGMISLVVAPADHTMLVLARRPVAVALAVEAVDPIPGSTVVKGIQLADLGACHAALDLALEMRLLGGGGDANSLVFIVLAHGSGEL